MENIYTDDFIENLVEENANIISIVEAFDNNKKIDKTSRENIKILKLISDKFPHKLYTFWDLFFLKLNENNEYKVLTSIYVISNLLSADKEDNFYNEYDKFFKLLYSNNLKYTLAILDRIPTILLAKPYWENKITNTLLEFANFTLENNYDNKILLKLIDTFDSYFTQTSSKFQIINIWTLILNRNNDAKIQRKIKSVLRKRKVKVYNNKSL
ncbi:MAG TPA: hypothetical protein PK887_10790 [Ignavibacteriales bacterium]|nr:hypothetical protein [Ignavibacteriales bacterium]